MLNRELRPNSAVTVRKIDPFVKMVRADETLEVCYDVPNRVAIRRNVKFREKPDPPTIV